MEDKIDTLSNSIQVLQEFMLKQGMASDNKKEKTNSEKKRNQTANDQDKGNEPVGTDTVSETTIYHNVLEQVKGDEVISEDGEITFRSPHKVINTHN